MARKPISKKDRFEVFKRDKFTCQYCGRRAPDVVLQIDHIQPIAKGGDNEILNLITSCFDCNNGKRDIPLCINDTLEKERRQLEILQERREQIEMIYEWRMELEKINDYSNELLLRYIESKIEPHSINNNLKDTIYKLTDKYEIEDILTAVNISRKKYLRYDYFNKPTIESIDDFINRIGGIVVNNKKPPIARAINHIRAICKNKFRYWNNARGLSILNEYVKALKNRGWDESSIVENLNTKILELAKDSNNWTMWKTEMELLILSIKNGGEDLES